MDASGMTPLMWACYHNRPKNVAKLLKYGADLDEKDIEGKTACHWAVHEGEDIRCLKMLLTYENSFWRDAAGRAVIHLAAESKSTRAIKLAMGVRPDSVHDIDRNGRSPLHWAAACGSSAAVKARQWSPCLQILLGLANWPLPDGWPLM